MASRPRFLPRYRTVWAVPWWWPIWPKVGLAIVIAWLILFARIYFGGPVVPR